jgi:glycosyltransferase involved in cell wall biosynthesis
MMKPERLLIISPLISVNAPQPARFRELVSRWSSHFDITVLSFNTGSGDLISGMGASPALMEFNAAGRLLIGSRLKNGSINKQGAIPGSEYHRSWFRSLLKKAHINMFFFPDVFIVEYLNIKRHLFDLAGRLHPATVIISTAPFTLMLLAGPLKRRFPQIRVVIDTGDPFRGDSSSYSGRLLHRLFAGKVERKCLSSADMLVVPTETLRRHYLASYAGIVAEENVKVIEIGISEVFGRIPDGRTDRNLPVRMVYAGRFYRKLRDPSELYRAIRQFPPGEVILKVFGNIQDRYKPPVNDVRFFTGGAISSEQLALEYEQSDIVIFPDNAMGFQVPGKLYEVLAVNRPVLYIYRDSASPSYDLVKGQDGVLMVRDNYLDIAAGITQIMKMKPGKRYSRGSDIYSYDSLAERYRVLLEDPGVHNQTT